MPHGNMWDAPGCPLSQTYVNDLMQIDSTLAAAVSAKHHIIPGAGHSLENHSDFLTAEIHSWLGKHLS